MDETLMVRFGMQGMNRIDHIASIWRRTRSKTIALLMEAALDREERLIRIAMNSGVDIRTLDRPIETERDRMDAETVKTE